VVSSLSVCLRCLRFVAADDRCRKAVRQASMSPIAKLIMGNEFVGE